MLKSKTKEKVRHDVARNLRAQRERMRMTQQEVADLFNPPLTRAAVAQWELGITLPTVWHAVIVARAFRTTVESLVFGEEC